MVRIPLGEGSPGRARTYDKRINSKANDSTLPREKTRQNEFAASWATTGATREISLELQDWIVSCPVQLEEWQIKTLVSILGCEQQAASDSTTREHRIILLDN